MGGLIRITPNKEKAKHMLKIAEITVERLQRVDFKEFITLTIKDYYDVIKELMTAVALLDGCKTEGDGSHKKLIEYIEMNYKEFKRHEIQIIDDLREKRNRTYYEGLFIPEDYLEKRRDDIKSVIAKLKMIINDKLN